MTSDQPRGGRPDGVSPVMSHYLGELYRLGGADQLISPSDLAEVMGVSPPAASRMMERLEGRELVERVLFQGVRLSKAGCLEALREIRYHRLSEAFLVRVMDYGWHEAHDMADSLAKVADPEFVERMDRKAGFPKRCPHGEPIPTAAGEMPRLEDVPLTDLEVGEEASISRVKIREDEKLIYLAKIGLVPEANVRIMGRAPFAGPLRVAIGKREEVLGVDLAAQIRVERVGRAAPA